MAQPILTGLFNGTAILWNVASGTEIRRIEGLEGQLVTADFSPDGHYVLIGHSDWVQGTGATGFLVWNVETGEVLYRLNGNIFLARSVEFSPNGQTVLTGSQNNSVEGDTEFGDLILWDMTTGQEIRRFEMVQDVTSIEFSADGLLVLTSSTRPTGLVTLWDVATGQPIRYFEAGSNTLGMLEVVFGPREQTVLGAAGDGNLYLWDIETGEIIRRFSGHGDWVFSLDLSPDKRYAISVDMRGMIILWDFETGQVLRQFNISPGIANVIFSPDGQFLRLRLAMMRLSNGGLPISR